MEGSVVFVGDRDDPWADRIARRLPPGTARIDRRADLGQLAAEALAHASLVVVHAPAPSRCDADLIARVRARGGARVILCAGALARYHQLEPLAAQCDAIVPETTAVATIDRHVSLTAVAPSMEDATNPQSVAVVSTDFEMRTMLSDVCQRAGLVARPALEWNEAAPGQPAIWDVPVLEAVWEPRLTAEARLRPVVVLAGFLDRPMVERMWACGAACCLDLPCEAPDLQWVVRRLRLGSRQAG